MFKSLKGPGATVLATLTIALAFVAGNALPASASSGATVMTVTQRMSDATLSSNQSGTYTRGQIQLICYKYGQAVKGYYSPWIRGGWDSLWYRVSDGYYVADVDINTGSNNPVTPACVAPPTVAAPSSAQRAVAWASSQVHSNAYSFACELFVENAYGTHGRFPSALAAFSSLRAAGQMHYGSTGIPAGALVFSSNPKYDLGNGHVMLSLGDGRFISGGVIGSGGTVQVIGLQSAFLGWAYAPSSWPGR